MYHGKTEFLTELSSAVYKYIDIPLEKGLSWGYVAENTLDITSGNKINHNMVEMLRINEMSERWR